MGGLHRFHERCSAKEAKTRKKFLPAQKVKNKRYNDTDEQASGYRKVKGESFSLNVDISRQMSEPGNFSAERNKHPKYDQNQSDINQAFSEARHFALSRLTPR
jgi:hypothetical protein